MRLNRRYKRNIKENLSFYIASTVLTIVSIVMFFVMNIAGSGIMDFGEVFLSEHNVEDASFTTYQPISEKDMERLEKDFDVELETQRYINIEGEDYTVRVFSRNKEINLPEITAGRDIEAEDEILLSEGFSVNHDISIGDSFSVDGKDYRVCGFFQRPDYLYMLEDLDSNYKNDTTFLLSYVSDDVFDSLNAGGCRYMVVFHKDNQDDFRKEIYEDYMTGEYVSAEENLRITMVEDQAQLFLLCSWVLLVAVSLVTVALISIIIRRKVQDEQKMIGTLSALGYRKKALVMHYVIMGMIPGLLGGVLTVAVTSVFSQPYGEMGLADYEPLHIEFSLSPLSAAAAIVIPTLMYALSAARATGRLLKRDTVLLLNGAGADSKKTKKLWIDKRKKIRTKFAFRSLLANPGRSFVVLLGIFLGAFITMFAFMTVDAVNGLPDAYREQSGDYAKQYVLNTFLQGEPEDGEPLLMASFEHDGSAFTMVGADADNSTLNLKTDDGRADLDEGWYISNLMAHIYDIEAGDTFTFVNGITLEEYQVTIEGIVQTDMQKYLIGSREAVGELLDIDADQYNGILSRGSVDIDQSLVAREINDTSIDDQMKTMMNEMGVIIYTLIIIGGIICIAAVYVAVNMMVTENRLNISMLKVLGYRDKEINQMVLSANHVLLPVGIAAGILAAYLAIRFYFASFAEMEGMLIPTIVTPASIGLTIVIVSVCYFVSLALVRRKAARVDMVESLKDNRQ